MKIFDPKLTGSIEILNTISGNVTIAGGLTVEGSLGGSATTASYVEYTDIANKPTLLSGSAQIALDISGSFTSVSSSIASTRLKNTTDILTGDLTVTGTITAQEFHTEFVSASIIYKSGSTKFGDTLDDKHHFTGSLFLTGSVGINTTDSNYTLAVSKTLRVDGLETTGTSVSFGGRGDFSIDAPGVSGGRFIVKHDGKVGIGTATPSQMLTLWGGNMYLRSGDPKIIINNIAGASNQEDIVLQRNDSTQFSLGLNSTDAFTLFGSSTSTQHLVVNSSGNVGIGATSPSAKLHIEDGAGTRIRHGLYGSIGNRYSSWDTWIGNNTTVATDSTSNIQLLTSYLGSGATALKVGFADLAFYQWFSSDLTGLSAGSNLTLPTPSLEVNSLKNISIARSVYIGTEAANNGTTYLFLRNYDSGLVSAGAKQNSIIMTGRYYSGSSSQLVQTRINSVHQLADGNGGSALTFETQTGGDATVEQMRIDRLGLVGIGTTNPEARFHIVGDNKITGYSSTNTVEFTAWFQSGTHSLFTLSNFSTDTVAVASLEWALLYAYAGDTHAHGIKMASTRRINNNTDWRDLDNTNVSIVGDTVHEPNLYWDLGVLKMEVGSSVQITARIRLTAHTATITRNYSAS